MRERAGEPENAAGALERGLSRGIWYGKFDFLDELWAPLRALPRFAQIEKRREARRAEAEKLVKQRLDVVVPPGASPGFGSLCPPRPPGFTAESARAAAARGVKGTLLTTERDGRLADQREMAEVMRGAGLLFDFVVTPDIGHWYPADLAARIDATLRAVVPLEPSGEAGERTVVEAAIRDSIGWALRKDRARLESVLTHDDDLFIFHPGSKSTVRGWAAFSKLLDGFMDPRFVATRFEVKDLAITFSPGADVAWFSALLEDCGTWEGKESCWKDTRWTGVLEKRAGSWKIVQMHFSFAKDKVLAQCPVPAA